MADWIRFRDGSCINTETVDMYRPMMTELTTADGIPVFSKYGILFLRTGGKIILNDSTDELTVAEYFSRLNLK